jgi:hypothetical protein
MNPNTNSATLKITNASVYCFQSWGPESSRASNQRSRRGALYWLYISQAKYLLSGIDSTIAVKSNKLGSSHIGRTPQ